MSREMMITPTEPGAPAARLYGCTCPVQAPVPIAGGGIAYARSEDCPLHQLAQTFADHGHAQRQNARRDRERAGQREGSAR